MDTDWSDVYRATYPELVRYVYRKLWDTERAHELVQEAFLRGLGRSPEDPRGWLFTVAGNLVRDEVRKVARRRRHLTLIEGERDPADGSSDPERDLEERERREQAREALEALGERDREALLLWDAGFSYEEIAGRMDLSPGAVGTTLARARQRLRAAHRERVEGTPGGGADGRPAGVPEPPRGAASAGSLDSSEETDAARG